MSERFDYEQFKAKAIEQLKSGVPLSGKDGILAPLLENLLNSALEGEMDSHLEGGEREFGNRRNGHMSKQVQTTMGEITINTPRDRDGTFDPQVVRKREKILADSLADRIIGLYAIGNSTREISDMLEEQFGNRISAETISSITDRVLPEIQAWKSRPLESVYPVVWLDAVHYKVMDEKNRPETRAIYNVLALNPEGRKELLGMYISRSEGANFWLGVLTDLQNRGVHSHRRRDTIELREQGKRIIRVSLVGAEVPKDSIAVAQARLPQYGLAGAVLEVRQGYGQSPVDMSTLSSTMFKDIYLHNQEQITRQQQVIDSLENLTSHYQQYDSVGVEVAPEIKVLFPNVTDIAISKTIFSQISTETRDTTTLAVVRNSGKFSLSEQTRFKEWLQARLGVKKVQLVVE